MMREDNANEDDDDGDDDEKVQLILALSKVGKL